MSNEPEITNEPLRELLSDGRYAEILAKPKYADFVRALADATKAGELEIVNVHIAAQFVRVGDKLITAQQIMNLDFDDGMRVMDMAARFFPKPKAGGAR
jgi:hypothetical protein